MEASPCGKHKPFPNSTGNVVPGLLKFCSKTIQSMPIALLRVIITNHIPYYCHYDVTSTKLNVPNG